LNDVRGEGEHSPKAAAGGGPCHNPAQPASSATAAVGLRQTCFSLGLGARITARYRALPDGEEERGCDASARRVASCPPPLSSAHEGTDCRPWLSPCSFHPLCKARASSSSLLHKDNAAVSTWRRPARGKSSPAQPATPEATSLLSLTVLLDGLQNLVTNYCFTCQLSLPVAKSRESARHARSHFCPCSNPGSAAAYIL
jgi:hypothetical protein